LCENLAYCIVVQLPFLAYCTIRTISRLFQNYINLGCAYTLLPLYSLLLVTKRKLISKHWNHQHYRCKIWREILLALAKKTSSPCSFQKQNCIWEIPTERKRNLRHLSWVVCRKWGNHQTKLQWRTFISHGMHWRMGWKEFNLSTLQKRNHYHAGNLAIWEGIEFELKLNIQYWWSWYEWQFKKITMPPGRPWVWSTFKFEQHINPKSLSFGCCGG